MRIENVVNKTKEEIGMRINLSKWMLVTLVICAFIALRVKADNTTVHLDYQNANPSVIVQLASADPSDTARTYAGGYNNRAIFPGGTSNDAFQQFPTTNIGGRLSAAESDVDGSIIQMFCIDLAGSTGGGYSYDTQLVTPNLAPVQDGQTGVGDGNGYPMGIQRANWLGTTAAAYWQDAYLVNGVGAGATASTEALRYGALQVAIWEIVFEGTSASAMPTPVVVGGVTKIWDVTIGNFAITTSDSGASIRAEANRILASVTANVVAQGGNVLDGVGYVNHTTLGALTSAPYQDMLVRLTHVPEPSGLMLAGLGLAGMVLRRKMRA